VILPVVRWVALVSGRPIDVFQSIEPRRRRRRRSMGDEGDNGRHDSALTYLVGIMFMNTRMNHLKASSR